MSETQLVHDCIAYLRSRGYLACRLNAGVARNRKGRPVYLAPKGWPDVIGCLPGGRLLCVECKATRKQSDEQIRFQHELLRLGGLYVVVRSVEDLKTALAHEPPGDLGSS